ncbi:MAG: TonB-dependent receptor [Cyanobacteria bacterium P01_C01_bin.89]
MKPYVLTLPAIAIGFSINAIAIPSAQANPQPDDVPELRPQLEEAPKDEQIPAAAALQAQVDDSAQSQAETSEAPGETPQENVAESEPISNEDVTSGDGSTLRINVTGEKFEDDIQEVAGSISVITAQEFKDSGIRSLQEIARLVPNFSFFGSGPRSNNPIVNIRGLANDPAIVGSPQSSVGIYIDDVPVDIATSATALYDIERIEVLRGPQGTLYGRNSQGGVINIITAPPDNSTRFNGLVNLVTDALREVQLGISTPLTDNLFLSLGGSYFETDGFIRNTLQDTDAAERQDYGFRGQLRWIPSDEWDIRIGADYEKFDDDRVFVRDTDNSNFDEVRDDFPGGFFEVDRNAQFARVQYTGPDLVITSISGRREWDQDSRGDADFTSADVFIGFTDIDIVQYSQELRVQSPKDNGRWRWLVGGFFEHEDTELRAGAEFGEAGAVPDFGIFPGTANTTLGDLTENTYAIFTQSSYDVTERLTLTAGLRFEHRDFSIDRRSRLTFEGNSMAPVPDYSLTSSDSILLPKVAIEYRFQPNILAYGNISRGYKPGGFNTVSDSPDESEFESETSVNYEVGLKTSWLDDRLTANLALFKTDVSEYQVVGFVGEGANQIVTVLNATDADIWGVELELRAKPTDRIDLIASFGYLNTEFQDFTDTLTGEDLSGNQLPSSPEYTYALAAQYRDPGGFFGRVELSGFGTYFFDQSNTRKQDPFVLVNARIGYEFDDFALYAYANNLFDQDYFASGSNNGDGSFITTPGDGRVVGVQFRASF